MMSFTGVLSHNSGWAPHYRVRRRAEPQADLLGGRGVGRPSHQMLVHAEILQCHAVDHRILGVHLEETFGVKEGPCRDAHI